MGDSRHGRCSRILILLVAIAFAFEQLIIPNQAVATVDGQGISVREFRQEYLLERNRLLLQLNQLQNSGIDMQQLGSKNPIPPGSTKSTCPTSWACAF